jgi:hypothetical protein
MWADFWRLFALMIGLSAGIVRADGQDDVMDAIKQKKNLYYVEIKDVKVSKILPDDTQGLPHQRWLVKLADGREIMAVYNTGEFSRVPMKEGDVVNMGGEFKMTEVGPLIHWLHEDPRDRRPDGYVQRDGVEYGKITK